MIPILTCTAVSAESLSPGGANVEAYRAGPSSHAVPGSAKGGTWQHTQIPSGMGSTSGRQPGWPSRQQGSPGYGGGVSTPNYYSHDARPTRPRAPMITPYDAYIPARHPPRPSWQQNDSVYAGGASVPIYGDREARPAWPPAPIEPQYGVVTPAPIEPQYGGVITRESVYPGWTIMRAKATRGMEVVLPSRFTRVMRRGLSGRTRPFGPNTAAAPPATAITRVGSHRSRATPGMEATVPPRITAIIRLSPLGRRIRPTLRTPPAPQVIEVHPSPAGGAAGPRRVY